MALDRTRRLDVRGDSGDGRALNQVQGAPVASAGGAGKVMELLAAAGLAVSLSACGGGQQLLANTGVKPETTHTIAVDTAVAGQLFNKAGPTLIAIAGVNVIGAATDKVADACAKAQAIGTEWGA